MWRSIIRPVNKTTQLIYPLSNNSLNTQIKWDYSRDLTKCMTRSLNTYNHLNKMHPSALNRADFFRFQSTDPVKQVSLKEPFQKSTPPPPPPPISKKSIFIKFLSVFASGAIAFYAISYYLDYLESKKPKPPSIDYSSPNLPGRIVPSKSVKIN